MPRPKKQFPPVKTREINIRFTQEQYDVLTKDAAAARLPRTEYIRQLIANRHPIVRQEIVFNDERILEALRNLGRMGNNLNQIAAYLNQGGTMNNKLWKEIKECISEIYVIRDEVREMVGEYRGSH